MTRISAILSKGDRAVSYPELSMITSVPGQRLNPIRHAFVADSIRAAVDSNSIFTIRDEFHAVSENGARYMGLFQMNDSPNETDWVIAAENANDGTGAFEIHSGVLFSQMESSMSFHESCVVAKKYGYLTAEEIQVLVNERVELMKQNYNLEKERVEWYKSIKLTREKSSEIICIMLSKELVAGRLSYELITRWLTTDGFEYTKPRTLWSLFALSSWFLNRLRASEMIERTIVLHHFFDEVAGFNKKATKWVQSTFA